jgi:tRNA nucleotidyltransferase/poly(A) polymerase
MPKPIDPAEQEAFAVEVVRKLRDAGYQAVWAGGCVRDRVLGLAPKDFDVATSATPEQVQAVFNRRKTLAIGASFGVITVLGPKRPGGGRAATRFHNQRTFL